MKKAGIAATLITMLCLSIGLFFQRHALACEHSLFVDFRDVNNQSARMAVEPLVDAQSLYDDLERISNGGSFHSVFSPTD